MARLALRLPGWTGPLPVKSKPRGAVRAVVTATQTGVPSSSASRKCACPRADGRGRRASAFRGALEVAGVGVDGGEAVRAMRSSSRPRRLGWRPSGRGGRRGFRPRSGVGCGPESSSARSAASLASGSVGPIAEGADEDAFFRQRARVRRQRAGSDAADLRVVRAAGGEEAGGRVVAAKTGVTTVTSGRWLPPRKGSLVM